MVLSIGEKTISEIQELARRDDVFSILLPSDIRVILMELKNKDELIKEARNAFVETEIKIDFLPWFRRNFMGL